MIPVCPDEVGFTHASRVTVVPVRRRLSGFPAVTNPTLLKLNACRTSPLAKPTPPTIVPLLLPSRPSFFLSPGHQLIIPSGAGVHAHLPALPAAKILATSVPLSARLK